MDNNRSVSVTNILWMLKLEKLLRSDLRNTMWQADLFINQMILYVSEIQQFCRENKPKSCFIFTKLIVKLSDN